MTGRPTLRPTVATSRFNASPFLPMGAFGIAFAMVMLMSLVYGGLHGYDGYFHVRLSAMYLSGEVPSVGEDFYWTAHSVWNGAYSDKDFLFHIFLTPLILIFGDTPEGLVRAGVVGAAVMAGFLAMVICVVMRSHGARHPLLWVVLLIAISETFIFRQLLCRSYLLSSAFLLLGWHLIVTGRHKSLAVLAAIYALTYTAPHLLLGLAILWAITKLLWRGLAKTELTPFDPREITLHSSFLSESRRALTPAVWTLLGLTVGWLLHPYPMNLAALWLLQNISVPLHSMELHAAADWVASLGGFASDASLRVDDLGSEMAETTGRELLGRHLLTCLAFVAPWIIAAIVGAKMRLVEVYAFICAGVFFALMLAHERFTEYFAPFAVLFASLAFARIAASLEESGWFARHQRLFQSAFIIIAAAIIAHLPIRCFSLMKSIDESPLRPMALQPIAELIKAKVPEGSGVFHAGWDAFPQLFFFAPEYQYVNGLDPVFLAAKSPDLYRRIRELGKGETTLDWGGRSAHEVIRRDFGMEFAIVDAKNQDGLATLLGRAELSSEITLLGRTPDDKWRLYWLRPISETLGLPPPEKSRPSS